MAATTVLLPFANGFEEIETMTIVDILRRAKVEVVFAAVTPSPVEGRSGVRVLADCSIDEALKRGPYDAIVLPGGLPNAYILRDDERIIDALRRQHEAGRIVAAICAAPAALARAGLLDGVPATNYPGVEQDLAAARYVTDDVVVSGRIITSRGPGTALAFSLTLCRELRGEDIARQVADAVLAGGAFA